ncbi:low specificity L-threonine aldolase, partial [bacterium]
MVDLRSDTVTKPTPRMRRAMAEAEVGDDVYGEDPTIRRLEETAAEMLKMEAAIYLPTGTMGNQVALHVHCRPGREVVVEARSHIMNYEMAAMAALSGLLPNPVYTNDGIMTAEQVEAAFRPDIYYLARTGLVTLENTHNMAGGRVMPLDRVREIREVAHRAGIPMHLDGARIFNAAASLGVPVQEAVDGFDSVMFCLSKGLGAPVGSMLCASKEFIVEARRVRKMFGGGMRQAGVIAAAGLVALEDLVDRVSEDHVTARKLAEGMAGIPGIEVPVYPESNILMCRITDQWSSKDLPEDRNAAS